PSWERPLPSFQAIARALGPRRPPDRCPEVSPGYRRPRISLADPYELIGFDKVAEFEAPGARAPGLFAIGRKAEPAVMLANHFVSPGRQVFPEQRRRPHASGRGHKHGKARRFDAPAENAAAHEPSIDPKRPRLGAMRTPDDDRDQTVVAKTVGQPKAQNDGGGILEQPLHLGFLIAPGGK